MKLVACYNTDELLEGVSHFWCALSSIESNTAQWTITEQPEPNSSDKQTSARKFDFKSCKLIRLN